MERIPELACYYIALLRSVYLVHQNHHWITNGDNFYGNHLLFERIYKSAAEDADLAAEKFIGLFGNEVLDLQMQSQMIGKALEEFSSGEPLEVSLEAENKFLEFSQKIYDIIKDKDEMTLGLDDMLMSIASNREGAVYLLKQTLEGHTQGEGEMDSKMAARMTLLKRMAQGRPMQNDSALKLQEFIKRQLLVNLGNRNWGAVGMNQMNVLQNPQENIPVGYSPDKVPTSQYSVNVDLAIPKNAPPFTDKKKYPGGLNQFKKEMIALIQQAAGQPVAVSMTVNGF